MKKIYILTAVFALLTLSLNAQTKATIKADIPIEGILKAAKPAAVKRAPARAPMSTNRATETRTLTVNENGTATNRYVPVFGYFYDYRQLWSQMIYTADQLSDLADGDVITSITFYPTTSTLNYTGGEIHVYMASCTESNFDAEFAPVTVDYDNTLVASFTPAGNIDCSNGWTITFDTPYTYTGGNLVIDIDTSIGDDYTDSYFYGVETSSYMGFFVYYDSGWSGSRQYFQPKATFTYETSTSTNPEITITPATQTIHDDAAGSLTVTGTNIEGNINVSLGTNTDWYLNPTSLSNTGGNVNVSYTGRNLVASNTVTASATGATNASATVDYVSNVYIVTDNGVTGNWDFTTGTQMSYSNGIYTATFTANADNTYILFARMLGNNVDWNTRYVFGPDSGGDWWLTGDSGSGTIDVYDDDPIKIVNGGTYTVIIDATDPNNVTFTITKALIPVGDDWLQMDGDYTNPNTLLSFEKDGEEIMLIDQFLASTLLNDHPAGYTYTLKETVNNEEKTSSPVNIPVYKTKSTMQGFYTQSEVESDVDMRLTAGVINSEMGYGVNPDHNTLYHSLYRGDLNSDYPAIDVQHRISQLQKYEEKDENDNVHFFFTEIHTSGITPMYDQVGNEDVEILDINPVVGKVGDELSYVPVIWTFGLYSGREDDKNNSYGSDIKREILGDVTAEITGQKSDYSDWGKWTYNGVEYCVYTPVIRITGVPPLTKTDGDGDVSTYVPYMYRAWCTYEGARDFTHNSDGQLTDNGQMTVPFLLGDDTRGETAGIIGGDWQPGDGRLDWAFGVPVDEDPDNVTFVIRFYYKKVVTEGGQNNSNTYNLGNRDGDAEYYMVETEGDATSIITGINELFNGRVPVSTTYVNAQGMQSSEPFSGLNIVVTRYSDGMTRTTKVVRR